MRLQPNSAALSILCTAILVLAGSGLAVGQDDARNINITGTGGGISADKWALLVGINDYERDDISKLNYAVADVEALYGILTDPNVGGFPKRNVKLMTTNAEGDLRPKRSNIMYWLGWLKDNVTDAGLVIVYFSGHGISEDETGESYLLPADADLRNVTTLQESSVPVARVQAILKDLRCKQLVLFLDACRNDPKAGKGDVDNPLSDDLARGLELEGEGRGTFYSCKVGERSYEWGAKKQGVFSYYLCDGLGGKAADRLGNVTLDGLRTYVTDNVRQWSRDNGREMTPWLHFEGTGAFVLSRGQPQRAKIIVESDPPWADLYFVTQDGEYKIDGYPAEISPGDVGQIQVKASKPGCAPKTETILVEPGEERTVTLRLTVINQQQAEAHTKNVGVTEVLPPEGGTTPPPPPERLYEFTLDSPLEGEVPGRTVVLMGSGPPGTEVSYTVNWIGQGLDPKITGDNIASGRFQIGDDGAYMSDSIGLLPQRDTTARRINGYTVRMQAYSQAVQGEDTITRRIRGDWTNPQGQQTGPTPPPPPQYKVPWRFEGVVMDYSQVPGARRPPKRDTGREIAAILGGLLGRRRPRTDTEKLVTAGITAALASSSKPGEYDLYVRWENRPVKVTVDDRFVCGSDVGSLPVTKLNPGDVVRVDIAERLSDYECTAQGIYLTNRPGGLFGSGSSLGDKPGVPTVSNPRPPRERPPEPQPDRNWRAVSFRADAVKVQGKSHSGNYFICNSRGKTYRIFCQTGRTRIIKGASNKSFQALPEGALVDIKGVHTSETDVKASLVSIK